MLFHVAMTHTADNCPAYHSEMGPGFIASMETSLKSLARS